MIVKLLTEHHLEFLSLKGGRTGSSESTLVKMPSCHSSNFICAQVLHVTQLMQLSQYNRLIKLSI